MIKPFSAHICKEILDDLKTRIRNARWTDEITHSNWNYGTSQSFFKELCDYGLISFDWRKVESEVNSFPNFIVKCSVTLI